MDTKKICNSSFARDETGGITAFGLFLITASAMVGSYAVDWSNLIAARTHLQVAADAAAHAALLKREFGTEADAVAEAIRVARMNMPVEQFGEVLTDVDVEFGTWDPLSFSFSAASGSREAVRVKTRRIEDRGNQAATYLLRLVGINNVSMTTEAVFVTYRPTCLREGFVAESIVDIQSNNSFSNGFCVHSNDHVSLNSNNYFEPGTVVSMPDMNDIELPNSGFTSNTGLAEALREGSWNIRILNQLEALIDGLESGDDHYRPEYITSTIPVALPSRNIDQADLIAGRIHTYSCNGGAALTFNNNVNVAGVVVVTNCKVKFSNGVVIDGSVIATRNNDGHSITGTAGLQVGRNDNCAEGGGSQLLTLGSMDFPSDLRIYGSQLIARHDISFAANANGVEGAAMVAGGEISGTSNMDMGFCGSGMNDNFAAAYFKLAQ